MRFWSPSALYTALLIAVCVVIVQFHAIAFWAEHAAYITGWLWAIGLEMLVLWLWFQRRLKYQLVAAVGTVILLAGPVFTISSDLIETLQYAQADDDARAARVESLRDDIDQLESDLATFRANSEERTGWLSIIRDTQQQLSSARVDLRNLQAQREDADLIWLNAGLLVVQIVAVVLFHVGAFLGITWMSARLEKVRASQSGPMEHPMEQGMEQAMEQPMEQGMEQATEHPTEQGMERMEHPMEQATEHPTEQGMERMEHPMEQATEHPTEQGMEQMEHPMEQAMEHPTEQGMERMEHPMEQAMEHPTEQTMEHPSNRMEQVMEHPFERMEQPMEQANQLPRQGSGETHAIMSAAALIEEVVPLSPARHHHGADEIPLAAILRAVARLKAHLEASGESVSGFSARIGVPRRDVSLFLNHKNNVQNGKRTASNVRIREIMKAIP